MQEARIYVSVDNKAVRRTKKKFAYILECTIRNHIHTRYGYGTIDGTYNAAVIKAITEAVKRFNRQCDIEILSENGFVLANIEERLEMWAQNGFQTTKGKDVANKEEWESLWEVCRKHNVTVKQERHSYADWLENKMRKEE